jgi:hypothetical protein
MTKIQFNLAILWTAAVCGLFTLFSSQSIAAQKIEIFADWQSSPVQFAETPYTSQVDCESLKSWSVEPAQILLAKTVSEQDGLPEYCDVLGHIQSNIKFRMFMPINWNGRFFMVGNGGLAGDDLLEPGYPQHLDKMKAAIRLGFATAMTDSGHSDSEQPGGSFAYNNFSSEIDFAFRATHVVSVAAKLLIQAFYDRTPVYSYFDGCSGGGRQGLMSVQRYPDDFNGVVAGSPAFDWAALTVSWLLVNPILESAKISLEQVKTLGDIVSDTCDGQDGIEDGLIENPLVCDVDFETLLPVCQNVDKNGICFTSVQVQAITRFHADTFVNGVRIQPGFPPSSDLSKFNAWDTWLPSADKRDTDVGQSIAREVLRYIAFDNDDPAREIADFDADRDMGNFGLAMRMMDANDTDIRYFQNAGNKLLMYMGWEDLAFSPKALVEYYERLTQTMGKDTDDFARLFMAPGMYHCFGGPGPNKFDYMTPLVTWVEKGIAPETIIAHQYSKEKTVRTHPLCPWPKVAKYKGRGLVEAASSFSCTVPQ